MAKRIDVNGRQHLLRLFQAVEDVSMTIEPRSVTAFIGPSGCGKSTFLRTLNRMHEVIPGAPRRGQGAARRRGHLRRRASTRSTSAARSAWCSSGPTRSPPCRSTTTSSPGCGCNGVTQQEARCDEVVERSLRGANLWDEVKDRLDKPGAGLSGGQQQRLCIARAIAVEPQVLLMDEPCSALDPISTLAIEDLISELKENYTIVIVTHNMQQAARVSDRTGFFNLAGDGQARHAHRDGRHHEDLQQPDREGHRGLHLRPLRLSAPAVTGRGRTTCGWTSPRCLLHGSRRPASRSRASRGWASTGWASTGWA